MNKWLETDSHTGMEDASFKRLVVIILTMLFTLLFAAILLNLVTLPANRLILILAAAVVLITLILAMRGVLLPARVVTPSVLFVALVVINVFGSGNGIFDSSMIGLVGVVILAALLLGQRGALFFGVLVLIAILLMGGLDALGVYNPPRPGVPTPADITVVLFVTIASSGLVYLLIQRLTEIAQRARANEQLQIEANRELRGLQKTLEERIMERTRDLEKRSVEFETIADITRSIITIRNLETLLTLAAELIRKRFGVYHVGIFLVDELGEYAMLRAASSEAAPTMLAQGHKLKVGEVGIVGHVARTGSPRIALDVGADAVHFRNPLLPETRSEIGLPLRSRGITIGVLNIQATEPSAFSQQDIGTLQLLADELVGAIENAQLAERAEAALSELNTTYRSQTQLGWKRAAKENTRVAFEYDGLHIQPVPHHLSRALVAQLESGQAVILNKNTSANGEQNAHSANTLLAPLMVLNQLIGVIGLEQDDPNHVWAAEEIAVVEAAASRAAIALENARLLQDAQSRATRERTISDISAKIGNLVDLDNIIQTTIQELGRSMPDAQVAIQFETPEKRPQG
ncbi:MAG TPA: GAF domain-containing protein [Pyrinomonadaceae bacterium]|nr:GAF domain-containing protein [Pyrinomonadaceae bacterium]